MDTDPVLITKADGTMEPFRVEKLVTSLSRAGADKSTATTVAERIALGIKEKETTEQIYQRAHAALKKQKRDAAARYSIRRALLEFGPTGFPFERFVALLLEAQGFTTSIGLSIDGTCATHEVDVLALKDEDAGHRCLAVEAKFHADYGIKSDLKVALYVSARITDLLGAAAPGKERVTEGLLVTNTKFTKSACDYADCVALPMLSWNYPHDGSLEDLIESTGVYPVTVLTSLSKAEKRQLLKEQVALCQELPGRSAVLGSLGISDKRAQEAVQESRTLCEAGTI